jgi:hypothetical protein
LEYKLGFSEDDSMSMKRWVAKKRVKQYEAYQKAKSDEIKKQTNQISHK